MTREEMEQRLRAHAQRVLAVIDLPSDKESEEFFMKNRKMGAGRLVAVAAAAICILGTSCFAAYQYLSAREVVSEFGDYALAQCFDGNRAATEAVTDGKYRAALLGIVSGEKLSGFQDGSGEISSDRTYAVAAVERADGSDMTLDDEVIVTPLVQGFKPWQFNIVFMNGGYTQRIIDGVLYRLIECDNIEYFADRQLYLGIADRMFLNNEQFLFDGTTGQISENSDYDGTNILFELKLDPAKANPQKAQEYLKSLQQGEAEEEPDDTENDADDTENGAEEIPDGTENSADGDGETVLEILPDFSVRETQVGN